MRRIASIFLFTTAVVTLAGCNGETPADSATTTTKMDAVDVVQGTISDEMIASDTITEQAPVAEVDESAAQTVKGDGANGAADKKAADKKSAADPKPKPAAPAPEKIEPVSEIKTE
jgi:Prokaryotic membrane lipoprotein lipid attachment site